MATQINYTNSTLTTTNLTVSGETTFTNATSAPTCATSPTLGNELANKGYVDSLVGQYSGGFNMFFNYSEVVSESYKQLGNTIVNVGIDQIDTTTTSNLKVPVEAFISSDLNITTIPVGIWNVLVYGKISAATENVCYSCDILTVDTSGNEVIRATSNNSNDINALVDPAAYTMNVTLATPIACNLNTRLAVRIFVQNLSSDVAYTVSTYFQNTYYSFIQTSLNEGTTLLTSTNNWTGSNTFKASSNILSNINVTGNTINNADNPTTGNIVIGNSQTSGDITLGAVGRTGPIHIGRNFTPLYTSLPTANEIGYSELILSAGSGTTFSIANRPSTLAEFTNVPFGVWLYEINCYVTSSSTGRVFVGLSLAISTLDLARLVSTPIPVTLKYMRVSSVLKIPDAVSEVFVVCESTVVSVPISNIYVTRTRIA